MDKRATGYTVNAFASQGPERGVLPLLCRAAKRSRDMLLTWLAQGTLEKQTLDSLLDTLVVGPEDLILESLVTQELEQSFNVIFVLNPSVTCSGKRRKSAMERFGTNLWGNCVRGPPFAHVDVYTNLSSAELSGRNLICGEGGAYPHYLAATYVDKLR